MKIRDKARSIKASIITRNTERKRLRGPANLKYAIADSIAMLDQTTWQQLTSSASFFMSCDYLKGLEAVLPGNIEPRYALIYQDSEEGRRPLAAVYMQIAEISLAQVRPERPTTTKRWPNPISLIAEKTVQRVLTCGNLLSYGQHGIVHAEDADQKLVWHGLAEVLYRVRQADKLLGRTHFVMIKDLHAPYTEHAKHLLNLSYRYVETEPNMVLTLRDGWQSHDDYLASLASKYRSGIKNAIFKPMEDAGCVVEHLHELEAHRDTLFRLYKSVQTNADFRPFQLGPSYFPALQKIAGDRLRCSVVKRDEAILGFLISVADGDTAIAYHIGFDREAGAALPVYLRLLHAGIADALALGCRRISYGRTALEPKAALGAKPEPFGVLLRHCQPVFNKMIKQLLTGIEHEDAPERNPFKKVA